MKPDLEDIQKKVTHERDLLERIMLKIPGFKGYYQQDERTDADRIVRGFLSDRLSGFKRSVDTIMTDCGKKGAIDQLADLDSLNLNLERLLKKCTYADFGSAASLSRAVVSEEDRQRVLQYDYGLIGALDVLAADLDGLRNAAPEGIPAAIDEIKKKLAAFEQSFDDRKTIIMEVL